MTLTRLGENKDIVLVEHEGVLIADVPSALDLMATVQYETGCHRAIVYKDAVSRDFFILSTGLAGEILQKYVNHHFQLAMVGDYSGYTSEPLQAFIRESNRGRHFFFVETLEKAIEKLSKV